MFDFLGLKIQSPIIIGSGPLSYGKEGIEKLYNAGAGAIVTKTIRLEKAINPINHMIISGKSTLINCEKWSDYEAEKWIQTELPYLNKKGIITIASIGHTLEESSQLIEKIVAAGAHAVELVSYNDNDLIPMLEDAKRRVNVPIIVKLPQLIENIGDFAKKLEKAGANAITACDSLGPAMRVDIKTGQPLLGGNGYGWLTGEAIKPITLHKIFEIKKQVNIPIIGLGGCMTGEDAIEMAMVGANFIGICTAPIINGEKVINTILNKMDQSIKNSGYSSFSEIIGLSHNFIDINDEEMKFKFNKDLCIGCQKCEKVCSYDARFINNKEMRFNKAECRYCGLCVSVCPTKALGSSLI